MSHEQRSKPRDADSLQPEELDAYLAVPGWRFWRFRELELLDVENREFAEALEEAEAKSLALKLQDGNRPYWNLLHIAATRIDKELLGYDRLGRGSMPFPSGSFPPVNYPFFLLEPLTTDEVNTIDEQGEAPGPVGSVDKPHELLRPEDLREILK